MTLEHGIHYIGVNDYDIQLFEGQYHVPNGMAYNSYIIADEKTAIDLEIAVSFITFNEYETLAATRSTVYKDKPVYTPAHSAVLIYYPSKDEKLWGIAKKYNTTGDALRRANGITGDFATGSMLIVPRSTH